MAVASVAPPDPVVAVGFTVVVLPPHDASTMLKLVSRANTLNLYFDDFI